MNTNGNIYTVVYTAIVVILVAAILAFTSLKLAPKQNENVKADAISQMLTATKFYQKSDLETMGNAEIVNAYKSLIKASIIVDGNGQQVGTLNAEEPEIYTTSDMKKQGDQFKDETALQANAAALKLPVFEFEKDGESVYVIPCYGGGLWGPIWGYLAFNADLKTIRGAYFDHASETPGLGAKIKDEAWFREQFEGKQLDWESVKTVDVVKGGAPEGQTNGVDAITGATITSQKLGKAINNWLMAYKAFLTTAAPAQAEEAPAEACDSTSCCNAADSLATVTE